MLQNMKVVLEMPDACFSGFYATQALKVSAEDLHVCCIQPLLSANWRAVGGGPTHANLIYGAPT